MGEGILTDWPQEYVADLQRRLEEQDDKLEVIRELATSSAYVDTGLDEPILSILETRKAKA